jgi:DNA-binding NtrC family response regulator
MVAPVWIKSFGFAMGGGAAKVKLQLAISIMNKTKFIPPAGEKTYEVDEDDLPITSRPVLLVEDDDEFTEMLKGVLEVNGYRVITAKDGVEGLKKVMADDYEVILCDLMMPNLPGNMFYMAVEKTKPAMAKRFIFMTGHKADPKMSAFLKQTRALALFKPFQMHDLLEYMKAVVRKNRARE